jgi:1-acyl-sn-glycerol-3-phosphate acyltransferase
MFRVLGIAITVEGDLTTLTSLSPADSLVVVCNHQSWFDVFLLQTLISKRGPSLKFLIKAKLLWIPVLGWVCLALNFPRLSRKGDAESRSRDLNRVVSASLNLGNAPGGLVIFPEGTRFSEEKRRPGVPAYKHVLPPKPGGFSRIHQSMSDGTNVLDVSIRYGNNDTNCWRCMSGAVSEIRVRVDSCRTRDIQDVSAWLASRWTAKDAWLTRPETDCDGEVIRSGPLNE